MERYKEPLKAPSPIYEQKSDTVHNTTLEDFRIIGRNEQNLARYIKESIYIIVKNLTLNRNIGRHNLPHIWNRVLFTIQELEVNNNHKQWESKIHNTTTVPVTRSFVEENIQVFMNVPVSPETVDNYGNWVLI